MSKTEQVMESMVVHNQLSDGEQVVALNGTMQGKYGLQVVCIGDIEATTRALGFDRLHTTPDSTAFYGYWFSANLSRQYSEHKRFKGLVDHLGFSAIEESSEDRKIAITTSPAGAEYLNNALDDLSQHRGFRFYDFDFGSGEIPGSDYLMGIADGYAPVAPFGIGLHKHDMFDHALGFAMLGSRATRKLMNVARQAIDNGIDAYPSGELVLESPASKAAQKIDDISGELTRPLAFSNMRYDLLQRIYLTAMTGQLTFSSRRA